jgi:hypothetical protein
MTDKTWDQKIVAVNPQEQRESWAQQKQKGWHVLAAATLEKLNAIPREHPILISPKELGDALEYANSKLTVLEVPQHAGTNDTTLNRAQRRVQGIPNGNDRRPA